MVRIAFTTTLALFTLVALGATPAAAQEGLFVFVPNENTDNVSIFRTNADGTLTAVTTIAVGDGPGFVAVRGDQAFAYVTSETGNKITIIDTRTQSVVDIVDGPAGGTLVGIAVSPDGSTVYVASRAAADTVQVYASDPLTGLLTSTGAITAGSDPRAFAVSADGSRLYVANQASLSVSIVDTATNTVIDTVNNADLCGGCAAFDQVSNIAINPAGTRVYVTSFGNDRVQVIDTATNTVIATPATGGDPLSVAVTPDGSTYYVVDQSGTISEFRTSDNGLIANSGEIGVLPSHGARGLTIHPGGGFVYATEFSSGANPDNVRMLSIGSGGLLTINGLSPVGNEPQYPAMCAATHSSGMLRTGSTFYANTNGAFGCFGASGTFSGGTLRLDDAGLAATQNFTLGTGGGLIDTNGNNATFSGVFSSTGALTKIGTGTLTLSGANNYSGATGVTVGTLMAGAANTFSGASRMDVSVGATLDLNNFSQTVGALAGGGTVSLGTATLAAGADNSDTTFSGPIGGLGGGLTKVGTGTLILTAANTYSGTTTVTGGTLRINGAQGSSAVTVQSTATLQGIGTTGAVTVNNGGTIAPGATPGVLNTGNLTLATGATFAAELNGTVVGMQYDQINVTGAVNITGATLTPALGFTATIGQVFTIINNDSGDTVVGTFTGRAEGSTFIATGRAFRISYVGGTGNDVTLTAIDAAPTITDIANLTITEDAATTALAFTVGDFETAAGSLTVAGSSSNTTVVPDANIVFSGSGADRTVTVTPAANQNGPVVITIGVSDGTSTTDDTFTLTITAVNDAPTITDVSNQTIDEDTATAALPFTVGDLDGIGTVTVSATSNNQALVPDGNLVIGGAGTNRTIAVTPAQDANGGPATITVMVSDGVASASDTFTLTVTAVNDAPTITDIANHTIDEDTATAALPFTVGDVDGIGTVTVSATSNNQALVPDGSIVLGGAGTNRTIAVTPAQDANGGPATITVMVSDGVASTSDTFTVTVTAVNDAPTISDIANHTIDEDTATGALPFTIGDIDTAVAGLTVSASSNDQTLVPNGNIAVLGAGASRTVTVTPATNGFGGPVTITLTVNDGALTATDTFTLTVTAVNDAPAMTAIGNQTIFASSSTPPLPFTVGDLDTAATSLTVSAASSNPALVTPAGFGFGGSGANRTLTVTPNGNATGTALITVTVHDGVIGTATSFPLTVTALPSGPPEGNQAPTVSGLGHATIDENATLTVTLTVGDDATPAGSLGVSAISSNGALVPASGVVISGAGATRTLTITPALDTAGQTTIAVTVSDGALSTTATALVTVVPASAGPPLQPPVGLTATVVGSEVQLSWAAAPTGARPSFYVIEGGTAPTATTLPVVNTGSPQTTWTLPLAPGTYFVRVRAGNRAGTSTVSNEVAVVVATSQNVPGAPVGLQVGVEGTRATFAWQRPVTGGEATAWLVELDTSPGPGDVRTFRLPAPVLGGSINLPRGEYVARVRGENSAGVGPPSNEPRFTVDLPSGGGCDAPDAPVLLPPTIVGRTVTLMWRPPRAGGPASYRLLVGSLPGGSDLRVITVGAVNAFVFEAPPGLYHATVVATNTCGPGAASNSVPVVVTGLGPPPPPTNVRFLVVGNTVTLAWDPSPGAASYLIEVGTAPGASNALLYPLAGTTVIAPDAPSGAWYVRVRAIGAAGASLPSVEVVIVVP